MKPNITSLLDNMVARGSALRSRSCEIEFSSKLLPKLKSFLVVVYFIVFTFITYIGLDRFLNYRNMYLSCVNYELAK